MRRGQALPRQSMPTVPRLTLFAKGLAIDARGYPSVVGQGNIVAGAEGGFVCVCVCRGCGGGEGGEVVWG